jgi:hypothetical protein
MGAEKISNVTGSHSGDPDPAKARDRDGAASTRLPAQEAQQPDPMLQMSVGRIGAGGLTLVAVVAALILAVVFYGLSGGGRAEQAAAAPPPPPAAQSAKPQAGGKSGAATPSAPRANESGVKG